MTMRLGDGYVSRHHPDDMIKYKGNEKKTELYDNLPESVLDFLGRPLSSQSLQKLAENDDLEIIYRDHIVAESNKVLTRSGSRKQNEDRVKALAKDLGMNENYQDDEDDFAGFDSSNASPDIGKRVSFGPTTYSSPSVGEAEAQ